MNDSELDELVARIAALPGPVRLVAIDGPGGCGKTTFAARLSDRSAHPKSVTAPQRRKAGSAVARQGRRTTVAENA